MALTPRFYRKKVILAKLEASYADPATTLVPADDAILAANMSISPIEQETVTLEYDQPHYGNVPSIAVANKSKVDFDIYLVGSGTAGIVPIWGRLLRACAFGETIDTGASVTYNPITDLIESLCIHVYVDGILHVMRGARGSVKFTINAKEVPKASFALEGLFIPAIDANMPAVTWSGWKMPRPALTANTIDFALHGFAAELYGLEIDVANEIKHRNIIGIEDILITDRKPAGSLTMGAPLIGTFNWVDKAVTGTVGTLVIQHDTRPGHIVKFEAPKVQITKPAYENKDGVLANKFDLTLLPDGGNDELIVTLT